MAAQHEIETLAHDLKNVFQTIVQAADLIALDSRNADLAGIISRSVEQGRRILASAVDPGGQVLLAAAVDAAAQFTSDFSRMSGGPNVNFTVSVDPAIQLNTRPCPLERSLINLFINAVEAGRTSSRASVELRVSARRSDQEVAIRVEDDGPGIPAAALDHVFEPGFSGTASGQGLGLHIVESTVVELGGSVTAANVPGGGAVFTLRLPGAEKARSAKAR